MARKDIKINFHFRFIKSVLNVTKSFGFDGLDLDWEFPAWLGADDMEKIHFTQLLEELRNEFHRAKETLILSVAVAAPQVIVDRSKLRRCGYGEVSDLCMEYFAIISIS